MAAALVAVGDENLEAVERAHGIGGPLLLRLSKSTMNWLLFCVQEVRMPHL